MFGFRTLDPDPQRSQALIDGIRITPFDGRPAPATRIVPPAGRAWNLATSPEAWTTGSRLHDIYQREIVHERDRFHLAMLRQLGIEKDKPFDPDHAAKRASSPTATAAGELMAQANSFAKRFPDALLLARPAVGSGRPARPTDQRGSLL